MRKVWPWIVGTLVVAIILVWLLVGRSERQAYWTAQRAVHARVDVSQERIDAAVEVATAAVNFALELAGDLPSQEAYADLVKQDIEEIGNRLSEAAEAQGEAAIEKLDASIDQFNQTLETVEDASQEATEPAAKAALYRISRVLEAAKDRIVEFVLTAGQ